MGISTKDLEELAKTVGQLVVILGGVGASYRWGVKPMWAFGKRLSQVADVILGDKAKKIEPLHERITGIEGRLDTLDSKVEERLASWPPARANGPRTSPRGRP